MEGRDGGGKAVNHTPTDEQAAIIQAATTTNRNILVNALAGAAKTSTLEMICQALPSDLPILSVAFNKRIATEMAERLPGNVRCATLNSIGHKIWAATIGKRLVLDTKKSYNLLGEALRTYGQFDRGDFDYADMLNLIRAAKSSGYLPKGVPSGFLGLIDKETFYASLEEDPTDLQDRLLETVLCDSIKQSYSGRIDFDDQILMSALFGGTFPAFPLVLVDEAQDLSRLNHKMLDRLVRRRIIAVGDPWQSIYAFRGADTGSMPRLRSTFDMEEFTLSVSFRCPVRVVERAHSRVAHFKWRENAPFGEVREVKSWSTTTIADHSAIICRNNAPLFTLALALMRAGRGCQVVGADIGPALIKVLKKLGDEQMPRKEVLREIDAWEKAKLVKSRAPASVSDRAECLRVFAGHGTTLSEAIVYAEHLFSSRGPIQLLSGHKAKGLEWSTVYHLDPWRIPSKWAQGPEAIEQELNIKYVIETRTKDKLFLINMNQMEREDDQSQDRGVEESDSDRPELPRDVISEGEEWREQDAGGDSAAPSRSVGA